MANYDEIFKKLPNIEKVLSGLICLCWFLFFALWGAIGVIIWLLLR